MASIARSMRAVRPSALSQLTKAAPRAFFPRPAQRSFSTTPSSLIRKYTKDHEWIDLNADKKTGVVGISQYAADALGDVVYVELPEEGAEVAQGDAIGAVESVKSAADINAPISCKVTQVNLGLEEKPGTINKVPEDDSHGGGWIAKVEVDEAGVQELEALMGEEEYKAFTASEDH
ncbi:glycine cleavage system H protein [Colletotrichum costaricense]|uniref:Glycine cleavage system H protein n=2 Tax=Colletotrichum acutatum species complex TaxID=2707335 RepID=A0AAI9Z9G8_9PEZI|nr:glycine cleavage system H protein [Colletotrichum costaricense]XP_060384106.1 glycine cleavage system H protein [Colletotrichum tamarilloi]KAI3550201.1 glycine cleavage system H protein [Colletotrichum filicis]KAK1502457.1 glycine cleavage system H protein [Colletotrichum tamarilloi]KAK1539346.1 glycine cleavage system H protein [Colletotrichum costaricense]